MSQATSLPPFDALSQIPSAPVSSHQKWYVMSGVGAVLAVALIYVGAARYFGEVLNLKRFALLGGGAVLGSISIVACRFGIQGAKNYKNREAAYQRQLVLLGSKMITLQKIMNDQNAPLERHEKFFIKTLSIRDQQILVVKRPELIKIIIEDSTDNVAELYLKVKQIVNGFGESDQPKTKYVLGHVVDVLHQKAGESGGLEKIVAFVGELFNDWDKAVYDSYRFIWAVSLASIFMECQYAGLLYEHFIQTLLVEDNTLTPTDSAHLIRLLGENMAAKFVMEDIQTVAGLHIRIDRPTLLQICLIKGSFEVIKQVQAIKPELFKIESKVIEVDPKDANNSKENWFVPRELYQYIHPPTSQDPEVLALLPERTP